jgi:hypothetical protein
MRKGMLSSIITVFFLLAVPLGALAVPAPKYCEVVLSGADNCVQVGEKVTLTALTCKHGSAFTDEWQCASTQDTFLDTESGNYVSTAEFEAVMPGTYTITYHIYQTAGKSGVTFTGEENITIEVRGAEKQIVGAELAALTITPVASGDTIIRYRAEGLVYKLYSDGTTALYGRKYFYFTEGETSKIIDLVIIEDGKTYTFPVTVSR